MNVIDCLIFEMRCSILFTHEEMGVIPHQPAKPGKVVRNANVT